MLTAMRLCNPDDWNWWLKSDAGLLARICIGAGIFAVMALWDLLRRGKRATRWREYLFLLAAVAIAMAYGIVNDRIASSISWEYFYYAKGLDQTLGPRTPPDPTALQWQAEKIGLKATWSAGLIVGVALLLANNPRPARRQRPQLAYQKLLVLLGFVLLMGAIGAAIGAVLGSRGWLAWASHDLQMLLRDDLFRPRRFMCVWGLNLGGYVGGIVGTIVAVGRIVRERRIISATIVRVSDAPGVCPSQ